jgi:hypothetical protein
MGAADETKPQGGNETQTKGGKVKLVMHERQAFTSAVELDGYTFPAGEPVEVPKGEAEKLLERRDEQGRKYVREL